MNQSIFITNNNLTPTTTKTQNYTAVVGDFIPCDTSGGNIIVKLPAAPADKSIIGVKLIRVGVLFTVSIQTSGSDTFDGTLGLTTLSLLLAGQSVLLEYSATFSAWYVISNDAPLDSLDLRYGTWTSYNPNYTGFTGSVTTNRAAYSLIGKTLHLQVDFTGTSNASTLTFTMPTGLAFATFGGHNVQAQNSGTYAAASATTQSGANIITVNATVGGAGGFSTSGLKGCRGSFTIQLA